MAGAPYQSSPRSVKRCLRPSKSNLPLEFFSKLRMKGRWRPAKASALILAAYAINRDPAKFINKSTLQLHQTIYVI